MKKRILCFSSLVLFLAFGMAGALNAQMSGGRIQGLVVDEATGKPIPDVTIKMTNTALGTEHLPSPVTDKDGHWSVSFLRFGMWRLEIEKVGYATQTVSYNVLYHDNTTRNELFVVKLRMIKGIMVKDTIVAEAKKADKLFQEKKYEEARTLLLKIISEAPEAYVLYKNIGNSYFAEENYESAIEAYQKVYEKDQSRSDVIAALANSYNNMGKKAEAADWYAKLPVEDIHDVDSAYNAGICLYNSGNTADAAKYFQKSVEIDPTFADGYYQLGMASVASNKSDDALAAFKKFLELAPDSPQAATARSVIDALTKK